MRSARTQPPFAVPHPHTPPPSPQARGGPCLYGRPHPLLRPSYETCWYVRINIKLRYEHKEVLTTDLSTVGEIPASGCTSGSASSSESSTKDGRRRTGAGFSGSSAVLCLPLSNRGVDGSSSGSSVAKWRRPFGVPVGGGVWGEGKTLCDGMLTVNPVPLSFGSLRTIGRTPEPNVPRREVIRFVRESFKARSSSTSVLSWPNDFSMSSCNFCCKSSALFVAPELTSLTVCCSGEPGGEESARLSRSEMA